jgi:hypothetical protein
MYGTTNIKSVSNYHYSLHDNPEEHSSQLLRRVSLKSREFFFVEHVLGHLAYFTTKIFFRDVISGGEGKPNNCILHLGGV